MWVTQTYLGKVEPDAEVYVYYLYENYVDDQKRFTDELQQRLENLGDVFGGRVCLSMPNPRYVGRIEAEIRENEQLWLAVSGRLPGLLLSRRPLIEIEAYDDSCFFISFEGAESSSPIDSAVTKIKSLADEVILRNHNEQLQKPEISFMKRFSDALEVKLGFGLFKIDLRKLLRR